MKLLTNSRFSGVNKLASMLLLVFTCSSQAGFSNSAEIKTWQKLAEITVYNDLAIDRANETVTIAADILNKGYRDYLQFLALKDLDSNQDIHFQFIDTNQDGVKDSLIFQPQVSANGSKRLQFYLNRNSSEKLGKSIVSYSRLVPERIDDYAWENDRVAFRVYGPKARQLVENGKRGGIISSGVDCWLKRVEYPILNKWYKKYADGTGDYHKDTGEGLDNYHVGSSLGCGGTGSIHQGNLLISGNFSDHKTTAIGPIRTSFELGYLPWNTGTAVVNEVKKISLDKGSNLTRYELIFDQDVEIVAGLSLDKNSLYIGIDEKNGYVGSWRKQQDSELGLGIVAEPKYVSGYQQLRIKGKPGEHLFVQLKSINKRIVYYAGFGWKKSQQFSSPELWQQYLSEFALKLTTPLRIQQD